MSPPAGEDQGPTDPTSPLDRVAALFDEAVALTDPAERGRFLADLRGRDPALGEELEILVRAHFAGTDFLDRPLDQEAAAAVSERLDATLVGRRLGPWEVTEALHHGGMGTVYRAERIGADFQQTAALKVIRVGYESPDLIRRFAIERQLLAQLEHPNIARLLDGGTTDDGLPYLVMEFVPGEPVDAWCDRVDPSVDQILDLFQGVARAVHFAHQNLIIHRDIKPSNILVTPGGEPKLLDFGLAKLLEATEDGPGAAATQLRMMTPAYSSPEQFQGGAVGTATDVYSLGVLLYRLLARELPYQVRATSTAREAERLICETMPGPPSERLAPTDHRRRRLRGDLDTIVLKALRKEPERRYGSVLSMVEDLERFRAGLPVSARPDTVGYRARRFAARNWLGLSATAAVFVALAVGLGAAVWQAGEAARQRDVARAEAATASSAVEFLRSVLWSGNPWEDGEPVQSVTDVLRYAEAQVEEVLRDEPTARGFILATLAEVSAGRGELERALRFSEGAMEVLETELSAQDARAPVILRTRAFALHESGQAEEAVGAAERAVERYEALLGRFYPGIGDPGATPSGADGPGAALVAASSPGASPTLAGSSGTAIRPEHAEALAAAAPSGGWRGFAEALNQLGTIELDRGNPGVAEAHLRRAIRVHLTHGGEDPRALAVVFNNLAGAILMQPDARLDAAAEAYGEAVRLAREVEASAPALGTLLSNQANVLWDLGDARASETAYLEARELLLGSLGAEHPSTIFSLTSLGSLYESLDRLDEAELTLRPLYLAASASLPGDHPATAYVLNVLGLVLCKKGGMDAPEGLVLARGSLEARRATLPAGHWALASGASVEGYCLLRTGAPAAALPILEEAHLVLREERGEDQELTVRARQWMEEARAALGG